MILTYLLSFSILIVSVIKMTDTMIELDNKLKIKREEFIKKTKSIHKNQKGNITVLGASLTVIVSAFLLFLIEKHSIELKEAKFRKESYLCMAYLNQATKSYVSAMTKYNWVLRGLFITRASGVGSAEAEIAIEATKKIRQLHHLNYLKNLTYNSYCKSASMSFSYLKNLPYQTKPNTTLKTQIDETTILGAQKWTVTLLKMPKGIRLKNTFCLKTQFELSSAFSSKLIINTSEIPLVALPGLSCLSGPQSS